MFIANPRNDTRCVFCLSQTKGKFIIPKPQHDWVWLNAMLHHSRGWCITESLYKLDLYMLTLSLQWHVVTYPSVKLHFKIFSILTCILWSSFRPTMTKNCFNVPGPHLHSGRDSRRSLQVRRNYIGDSHPTGDGGWIRDMWKEIGHTRKGISVIFGGICETPPETSYALTIHRQPGGDSPTQAWPSLEWENLVLKDHGDEPLKGGEWWSK